MSLLSPRDMGWILGHPLQQTCFGGRLLAQFHVWFREMTDDLTGRHADFNRNTTLNRSKNLGLTGGALLLHIASPQSV